MKTVVIVADFRKRNDLVRRNVLEQLKESFEFFRCRVVECTLNSEDNVEKIHVLIQEVKPDYICTLDMAGFELDTLTETFFYNICTAKQMHIVIRKEIWECFKRGEFAMNLYLFFPDETEVLQEKYPQIPNLFGYNRFSGDEEDYGVVREMVCAFLNDVAES